ncbi:hypothetical protein niasHT_028087 [Heterodera trifolii]|uniref:RRM domain-containing protein n=1 Tax=Heterodera trifolii TaxID=157864 RepID=A0ABD2KEL5_9BILA
MEEDYDQLDYDEDQLKNALRKAQQLKNNFPKEQERKKPLIQNAFVATKEARNDISSKCYINPKFAKQNIKNAPSLKTSSVLPPTNLFNYQPSQNINQRAGLNDFPLMQFSQNASRNLLLAPQFPCSTSQFSNVAHWHASFTPTIASNIYLNPFVFNTSHDQSFIHSNQLQHLPSKSSQNWHLMVDDFVKKTISVPPRNYPKNRFPSSDSSFSVSRPSTRSNSRNSRKTSPPTRKRRLKHNISQGKRTQRQTKEAHLSKQTMECAKAIGLDSDYLKKIEEQKKLREEIARKKSQHRKEIYAREGQKDETKEGKGKKAEETEGTQRQKMTANRLRPYLAVVVTNVSGLDDPCRRVEVIASKIGPIKKIWQENESNVHLIFEKHEHAKKFMQQYLGDSTTFGRMIDVIMKKVFLNTSTAF